MAVELEAGEWIDGLGRLVRIKPASEAPPNRRKNIASAWYGEYKGGGWQDFDNEGFPSGRRHDNRELQIVRKAGEPTDDPQAARIAALEAEVAGLRAAIEKHRESVHSFMDTLDVKAMPTPAQWVVHVLRGRARTLWSVLDQSAPSNAGESSE